MRVPGPARPRAGGKGSCRILGLGWIASAKREETKAKRIAQMLDELARGGVYMKMRWRGDT
jgi:hypothetical protein